MLRDKHGVYTAPALAGAISFLGARVSPASVRCWKAALAPSVPLYTDRGL